MFLTTRSIRYKIYLSQSRIFLYCIAWIQGWTRAAEVSGKLCDAWVSPICNTWMYLPCTLSNLMLFIGLHGEKSILSQRVQAKKFFVFPPPHYLLYRFNKMFPWKITFFLTSLRPSIILFLAAKCIFRQAKNQKNEWHVIKMP